MNLTIKFFAFLVISVVLLSCGGEQKFPSITETPTSTFTYGQVVWRELATPDPGVSEEFYKKVFGWTFVKSAGNDREYWLIKNNGKSIGGMFQLKDKNPEAGGEWVCSISVPSVSGAIASVKANGGKVILGPLDLEGRGKLALINDQQKAQMIILHSVSGDPVQDRTIDNQWLWSELWSNDVAQSENFYKSLINGTSEKRKDDNREYTVIESNGEKVLGIIENPAENVRSHWLQYIKVKDLNSVFEKAKSSGARVLIAPSPEIRKGTVAVLLDPTGAPFAIQKWPIEE